MNLVELIIKKNEGKYICFTNDESKATLFGTWEKTIQDALKKYIAMFMFIENYALLGETIPIPIGETEQKITIQYMFNKFYITGENSICNSPSLDEAFKLLIDSMN